MKFREIFQLFKFQDLKDLPVDLAYRLHQNAEKRSPYRFMQHLITTFMFSSSLKIFSLRHSVKVVNKNYLYDAVYNRPKHQSLLSFANHHSCLDDFLLFGNMLSLKEVLQIEKLRWSITSVEVCYLNPIAAKIFGMGKGIPIWRSTRCPDTKELIQLCDGIYQPSMNLSVDLLNNGQWVHIYPQGRIIMPEERHLEESQRLKWGISRLILDSKKSPLLLPIFHLGADSIAPLTTPYYKSLIRQFMIGKQKMTIVIGKPFSLIHEREYFLEKIRSKVMEKEEAMAMLTNKIQSKLNRLGKEAKRAHEHR